MTLGGRRLEESDVFGGAWGVMFGDGRGEAELRRKLSPKDVKNATVVRLALCRLSCANQIYQQKS